MSAPSEADAALRALAATDVLLVASDFDGTLAPLQDEPMLARMLPAARASVAALAALPHTTVALVSGRSLVDLEVISEHRDDSPILLAGSHGAEFWVPGDGAVEPDDDDAEAAALRDSLRVEAEDAVGGLEGAWIEPKTFGFGLHTRLSTPDAAANAVAAVDSLVRSHAPHWRRRTGHSIVEYAFRHEGKDTAVAVLRERTSATAVLFAGDDITDEDALASLGDDDVGVRVGEGPTAAAIRVPDIAAFAALLGRLAVLRADARE